MLNRPGRGIERIRPALIDEQFAATVLERAEVWVDSVDESSDAGIEICDVRGPIEARCVVGEVVVHGVLQDWNAECRGEVALLQRPFDFGAGAEAWVQWVVRFGVYWAGVDDFGCGELGWGEAG